MSERIQLVLDAGGVIVTNLTPGFWQEIAAHGQLNEAELVGQYKQSLSASLWSGKVTEPAFWTWLSQAGPSIVIDYARERLTANLTYLPAALRLQEWSRTMDLHLLSNHRTEWLLPVLQPYLSCFKSITISSEAGLAKPNPDLFTRLSNTLPSGAEVIFVDDHERNLEQGRAIGWAGLIADPENKWIDFVDAKAKI